MTTLAVTTSLATVAALALLCVALRQPQPQVFRSPLRTLIPTLSKEDLAKLDYSPDEFPGARDVDTPVSCGPLYPTPQEGGKNLREV